MPRTARDELSPKSRSASARKSESDRLHKPFTPGLTTLSKKSSARSMGGNDHQHKHLKRYSHSTGKKKERRSTTGKSQFEPGAPPPPARRVAPPVEAEVYSETANPQQAEDEIPAHWRSLPRTFAHGDRVQANLEDNSKVLGVVKRVYVKSSNGNPVGKYKISWEGADVDEMDVSDAESDNLEPYEGDTSRGFFEIFRCVC
uniref:Uncharacterized protein n=1 Tax=Florenciella parvula TaxID=236787 RepID=A0A7S2BG46_9STRA|mmetsp:Transcript_16469/g.34404  ORF Transcript_16469/g.34404 Transcript_16469/m.34404 type:complete len:201 (+) Transcript_16469:77-679(+)